MSSHDYYDDDELESLPSEASSGDDGPFNPSDDWIRTAEKSEQRIAMRGWFLARYCDPSMETPYSSDEGGYVWINGGPYDPAEELSERFDGLVEDAVIESLVRDLYMETGSDWAPIRHAFPDDFDYDERFSLWLASPDEPLQRLKDRLQQGQLVLTLDGDENAKALAQKFVYSNAIAVLEAFLWETVTYWVEHDEQVLRSIVVKIPTLRDIPMKLGEIFEQQAGLKDRVLGYLQNLVWHRWDQVARLITDGFDIRPPSFRPFTDALLKRHDIVHRSGHDVNGNPVTVTSDDISTLSSQVEEFADALAGKLAERMTLAHGAKAEDF